MMLFEYMIGNTDWSTYALHNMELVRKEDGDHLPIPYDFDFSGLVNTIYANPDPKLGIASVTSAIRPAPFAMNAARTPDGSARSVRRPDGPVG